MVDFQQDCPSIILDSNEPTFLSDCVELQNLSARGEEVSSILKEMVSNKVAAKETLQDLHPILESLVDIRARERRVDKETDIRVHISLLNVEGSQQQMNVMDPNHVTLFLDLDQVL